MTIEIKEYLNHLVLDYAAFCSRTNADDIENSERIDRFKSNLYYIVGRTYIKVVSNDSAHSFIVRENGVKFNAGDILKAASWAAPAKNFARGNIFHKESLVNISWAG